jgi:hypothetical protein
VLPPCEFEYCVKDDDKGSDNKQDLGEEDDYEDDPISDNNSTRSEGDSENSDNSTATPPQKTKTRNPTPKYAHVAAAPSLNHSHLKGRSTPCLQLVGKPHSTSQKF